jgi:hypothetical protein
MMKCALSISKFITYTYYGHPVDHCTISVMVSEELSSEEVEISKDNAWRRLELMPVKQFPVASAHGTLIPQYLRANGASSVGDGTVVGQD